MNKKVYLWIIPILIIAVLAIVTISNNGKKTISEKDANNTVENIQQVVKVLSVLPDRCRGCGKCMMVDPEHFKLDGGIAQVISQNNLDSTNLSRAIAGCKDEAIALK